jgi:hypothetical protein
MTYRRRRPAALLALIAGTPVLSGRSPADAGPPSTKAAPTPSADDCGAAAATVRKHLNSSHVSTVTVKIGGRFGKSRRAGCAAASACCASHVRKDVRLIASRETGNVGPLQPLMAAQDMRGHQSARLWSSRYRLPTFSELPSRWTWNVGPLTYVPFE